MPSYKILGIYSFAENIKKMQIANALPIVYEFDQNMQYINNYILLD
jgi:bisphosphoglycerate-dependent phosphoglycerate mutase